MRGPDSGRSWLAFVALALLLGFAFQGARGLWEPDEGRYAEVAREMLVSGDFLTPRLDLQPHFTKPPLTYWAIAASLQAFGRHEWVVRLFLSMSFALTGLTVALLGARMWDRKTGLLAGTIYLTSLTPFIGASFVTPDTLLSLWTALGLYGFWRSVEHRSGRGAWLWPIATGTAFGLGFLTKGPPALVFVPGMILWHRFTAGPRSDRTGIRYLPGILVGAALGLSWFVVVATQQAGLTRFFLEGEVVGRVLGHHHRNSAWYGPLVIYGPALVGGALPWCLSWPNLLRSGRAMVSREGGIQSIWRTRPRLALMLSCCLPALAIFCAVRSRLPLYVLPLFIPLALLNARALIRIELPAVSPWARRWFGQGLAPRLAVWVCCLFAIRLGLAALPTPKDARSLYRALRPLADVELIIDDHESHHGLAFYSERDVEYVSGLGASPESVRTIPIGNELAEESQANEEPHLYLVRRPIATRLDALLKDARATVRARQKVGAFEAVDRAGWTAGRGRQRPVALDGAESDSSRLKSARPRVDEPEAAVRRAEARPDVMPPNPALKKSMSWEIGPNQRSQQERPGSHGGGDPRWELGSAKSGLKKASGVSEFRLTGLPGCRDGSESAQDRGSEYPRWPLEVPTPLPCYSESRASSGDSGRDRSTWPLTSISIFRSGPHGGHQPI